MNKRTKNHSKKSVLLIIAALVAALSVALSLKAKSNHHSSASES